ncbi:transposase [Escherichia coli]|nr:transposase [Escherichia coli]
MLRTVAGQFQPKVFLTQAQLAMLLEGIDWRQPKRLLTSLTML